MSSRIGEGYYSDNYNRYSTRVPYVTHEYFWRLRYLIWFLGNHGQYMVAGQRATYEEGRNSNGADVVFLIERKSTCPADFHTHQVWTLMQSFLLALVKTYSMEVNSVTLSQKDKVQFIREY